MTEQVRGLLDEWTAGLAEVVASMADQKPEVRLGGRRRAARRTGPLVVGAALPGRSRASRSGWRHPMTTWEYAGTLTLKAAGLETVETNEARNTWLEILGQSLSGLARSIGGVLGREVACEAGAERAPEANPEVAASVSLTFGELASAAPLDRVQPQIGRPDFASRRNRRLPKRSPPPWTPRPDAGRAADRGTTSRPPWTCCWMSNCQSVFRSGRPRSR